MNLSLPVESVRERDIDFLLVEEFLSSSDFIDLFVTQLGLPPCNTITTVARSVHEFGIGETDVLVAYTSGSQTIGLFIENKLDALFQPQQAARYQARAQHHLLQHTYDKTYVVLVAPAQYIQQQTDFALCISYEQLMDYFKNSALQERQAAHNQKDQNNQKNQKDSGKRSEFKIQLLKIAAEKLRRGYIAINSEPNQAFWQAYRQQLAISVPTVSMKAVSIVPANSDWIDLTIGTQKFVHKLAKGYLDFISPSAAFTEQLKKTFGDKAEQLTFKTGTVMRIHTTPLDRRVAFLEQSQQSELCMHDIGQAVRGL